MAWCPRQTPRIGTRPEKRLISSSDIPASAGRPGPGEIRMRLGRFDSISSAVISSLRRTTTSPPSSPRYYQVVSERIVVVDYQDHSYSRIGLPRICADERRSEKTFID